MQQVVARPIGFATIFILLFSAFLQPQSGFSQQKGIDTERIVWVRALEDNHWIVGDTVVKFDPSTYEANVEIVHVDRAPYPDATGELVYQLCDQEPEFPGGQAAMLDFIAKQMHYPAQSEGLVVVVTFIVGKDGRCSGFQVEPGQPDDATLTHEAIRVLSTMPDWVPAQQRGNAVACKMQVPVRFAVD